MYAIYLNKKILFCFISVRWWNSWTLRKLYESCHRLCEHDIKNCRHAWIRFVLTTMPLTSSLTCRYDTNTVINWLIQHSKERTYHISLNDRCTITQTAVQLFLLVKNNWLVTFIIYDIYHNTCRSCFLNDVCAVDINFSGFIRFYRVIERLTRRFIIPTSCIEIGENYK